MTINQNDIKLDETSDKTIANIIENNLISFNSIFIGDYKPKPFTLYIKNDNSVIAGIVGSSNEELLEVDLVFIDKNYRRQGIGKQLFAKLEEYAKEKNCKIIRLSTYEFQAKPFYEKLGFECIGTISKFHKNVDLHFMRKTL